MTTDELKLKLLISAMGIIAFATPVLVWFILDPVTLWGKLTLLLVHVTISAGLMALTCRMILQIMEKHKL